MNGIHKNVFAMQMFFVIVRLSSYKNLNPVNVCKKTRLKDFNLHARAILPKRDEGKCNHQTKRLSVLDREIRYILELFETFGTVETFGTF